METMLSPGRHQDPLVILLLQEPTHLDAQFAEPSTAAAVMPRLITVSLLATGAHALAIGALLHQSAGDDFYWATLAVAKAYGLGFFGAQVAALPSAWFYALLAGIRQPAWRVAAEAMRAHATTSMVQIGLLPVYFAAALGLVFLDPGLFGWGRIAAGAGYVLPFVSGLAGTTAMYRAFSRQLAVARLDPDASRSPAPSLLVFAWSLLFTAMAPLGVAHFYGGL